MKLKKEELIDYFGLHIKNEMKDFVTCKRPVQLYSTSSTSCSSSSSSSYYGSLYDL